MFSYYLHKTYPRIKAPKLKIDSAGTCHSSESGIMHFHYIDQLDQSKNIVLIDFDDDDKRAISKMAFYKVVWPNICRDPVYLKTFCHGLLSHVDPTDSARLEKILLAQPGYLIFSDWKQQVETLDPVLTIQFKDIFFGNLNQILANYFQTALLPEVDGFIMNYRQLNQKYFD
jgi:hypothetical protein